MGLKLNNLETETLVKAINYVLDTNEKEAIPDVIELVCALQSGAKNAQNNQGKASSVNYGTILNVLENFVINMQNVQNEIELFEIADAHMILKESSEIERNEYLPYLENAIILKDRLLKELNL